jgi:hypothetical protein
VTGSPRRRTISGLCVGAILSLTALGCEVGIGQRCGDEAPCHDGLSCLRPSLPDGGTAAAGICDHPLRAEGEPCTRSADCEVELACSNHFQVGARYGACVVRHRVGEACFENGDCESNSCPGASGKALDGVCQ